MTRAVDLGAGRSVALQLESRGKWRHPSGLLLYRRRSNRWHLALEIPYDPISERDLYDSHPRYQWWLQARNSGPGLGDTAGRGVPVGELCRQLDLTLPRCPLPAA